MATGTATPSKRPEGPQAAPARYDAFIEQRLQFTRRQVKVVDVASGLMLLGGATLAFLLVVAVLDQWVVEGGLGFTTRLLLWLAWLAAAFNFLWRKVWPPLLHRINPIYAAHTIEQSGPTLKNSLINFLLLRGHREEVPAAVYQAMEHRAAADLAQVHIESAVDRGRVIHLSYFLAGAVAVFALYLAISPKNPLVSAIRVLWPWSGLAAPTRVSIADIRPGDVVAYNGERLDISADVSGLRDGENVMLLATTADGQAVDQPVAMTRSGEGTRYQASIPPGNVGLQQNLVYRLTAGDATSPQFKVEVRIAPNIVVDRIDYHFPAYTETPDRTALGQGDIRALEGTRVTLHATATEEIKDASIDLNCAGLRNLRMAVHGKTATGQFTLGFDPQNPARPLNDCYQVLFTGVNGQSNRRPVRYHVDVIRDLAPEVQILAPKEEDAAVAQDGQLEIRVRAEDTDYALRRVAIVVEHNGKNIATQTLLDRPSPQKPWQGPSETTLVFQPSKLGLRAGERVRYWAEAFDNKEPEPNRGETSPRMIHVVAPELMRQQPRADQQPTRAVRPANADHQPNDPMAKADPQRPAERGQPDEKPQDSTKPDEHASQPRDRDATHPPENKPDGSSQKSKDSQGESASSGDSAGKPGANADQNPQSGNSADPRKEPVNPDTQAGDAFEDILKHREKEQPPEKDSSQNSSGEQQQNKSDPEQDSSAGQQDRSRQQGNADQQNPAGQQGQNAEQKPSQGQRGSEKSQGENGQKQSQPKEGDQSQGKQDGSQKQPGQSGEKSGQNQSGSQKGAQNQPGQSGQQSGSQKSGEQSGSQNSQGQGGASGQKQEGGQSGSPNQQGSGGKSEQKSSGGQPGSQNQSGSGEKQGDKQPGRQGDGQNQQATGGGEKSERNKPGGKSDSQNSGGQSGEKSDQKSQGGPSGAENQLAQGGGKPDEKQKPKSSGSQSPQGSGGGQSKEDPNKSADDSGSGGKQSQGGSQQQQTGDGQRSKQKGGNKGGNDESVRQQAPGKGSGDPDQQSTGSPAPQSEKMPGTQKGENSDSGAKPTQESTKSPTTSPRDSDTQSETGGDRSGKGSQGGDQPGKKPGAGSSGSHTPTDEGGGSVSNERGPGADGTKAGKQVKTNSKTGQAQKEMGPGGEGGDRREEEKPEGELTKPQDKPGNSSDGHSGDQEKSQSGESGGKAADQQGSAGAGAPTTGGHAGKTSNVNAAPAKERGEDAANAEFTQKQVDLALEHLKDQLAKEKPELLEQLGWSREEAQRFLENWRKRMAAARQPGVQGEAARKSLNEAFKSLGLRPHGTQLKGGRTTADSMQNLRDAGQFDPPSDWADLFRAYTRSTSAGQK